MLSEPTRKIADIPTLKSRLLKRYCLLLLTGLAVTLSCNDKVGTEDGDGVKVNDPITMEFPTPTTRLWSVELTMCANGASGDSLASHSHGYRTVGWKYPETSVGWYRQRLPGSGFREGRHYELRFDGIFLLRAEPSRLRRACIT